MRADSGAASEKNLSGNLPDLSIRSPRAHPRRPHAVALSQESSRPDHDYIAFGAAVTNLCVAAKAACQAPCFRRNYYPARRSGRSFPQGGLPA